MKNNFQTIQVLIDILKKPKIDFTDYKCSTRHTVVAVLRKLIKGSTEVLLELLSAKYEDDLKDLIDLSSSGDYGYLKESTWSKISLDE